MSDDLLSRVRREIDARIKELESRVEEIPRLEAALAALDLRPVATRRPASRSKRPVNPRPKRRPPGANRAAILKTVGERPGASAAEIAKITGIQVTMTRNTLSALLKAGELTRDNVGGVAGYHRATS